MNVEQLIPAYEQFQAQAGALLNIQDEDGYAEATKALDELFEMAGDQEHDPYGSLIDMIANAIHEYEKNDEGLESFIQEAEGIPADIALLGVLIDQHGLTYSDLPEIGGKSMVSQVMAQKKSLSRKSMEELAERFGFSARLFFD